MITVSHIYNGLPDLVSSAYRAVSLTWCYWGTDVLYSDGKTDPKLRRLCDALYYNTASTDYPSTTTATSVGTPVGVNIDLWVFPIFFSIIFVWIIWLQYATDNISGQQTVFAS